MRIELRSNGDNALVEICSVVVCGVCGFWFGFVWFVSLARLSSRCLVLSLLFFFLCFAFAWILLVDTALPFATFSLPFFGYR